MGTDLLDLPEKEQDNDSQVVHTQNLNEEIQVLSGNHINRTQSKIISELAGFR